WCGRFRYSDCFIDVLPFANKDLAVQPKPESTAIVAVHDHKHDVVVLWRQDQLKFVPKMRLLIAERTLAAARHNVTHQTSAHRLAIASKYDSKDLLKALRQLLAAPANTPSVLIRRTDIIDRLQEYLQPTKWSNSTIRPWHVIVDLPQLGETVLDIFA